MKKTILSSLVLVLLITLLDTKASFPQTILLYKNSFESPLSTPAPNCGPDLDATFVNTLWGGTGLGTGGGGLFQQEFTVETILIHGPNLQYSDPSNLGGNYCLSMLSVTQNDRAALTLNSQMLPYANVSFLLSPIDLAGCGGPFGLDTAVMHLSVYDSPGGTFSFSLPGTLLDEDTLESGVPGATPYTFNWAECATSFDISASFDGNITIVFDLLQSGYAAFDSIEIFSSSSTSSVSEHDGLNSAFVFPNPFTNEIIISTKNQVSSTKTTEIILFDVMGKEILRETISKGETKINTEKLLSGFYLLNYLNGNKTTNFKLTKF